MNIFGRKRVYDRDVCPPGSFATSAVRVATEFSYWFVLLYAWSNGHPWLGTVWWLAGAFVVVAINVSAANRLASRFAILDVELPQEYVRPIDVVALLSQYVDRVYPERYPREYPVAQYSPTKQELIVCYTKQLAYPCTNWLVAASGKMPDFRVKYLRCWGEVAETVPETRDVILRHSRSRGVLIKEISGRVYSTLHNLVDFDSLARHESLMRIAESGKEEAHVT